MSAALEYDYRLTFVDKRHGAMAPALEVVSLAHIGGRGGLMTPCPWPLKMGTPTESLAEKHRKDCFLRGGCHADHKENGKFSVDLWREHEKEGAHDCTCPQWFKWLRSDLAKSRKAAAKGL